MTFVVSEILRKNRDGLPFGTSSSGTPLLARTCSITSLTVVVCTMNRQLFQTFALVRPRTFPQRSLPLSSSSVQPWRHGGRAGTGSPSPEAYTSQRRHHRSSSLRIQTLGQVKIQHLHCPTTQVQAQPAAPMNIQIFSRGEVQFVLDGKSSQWFGPFDALTFTCSSDHTPQFSRGTKN